MSFVSSESEESGNESVSTKESDLTFVAKFVRDNPIILNKGKTPAINKKKQDVLATLKQHYENNYGKPTDSKKLLKKVNNLKAVVKKKTDADVTGNKKKKLSAAEQIMYTALQGDQEECNPVLHKIPGHVAVGIPYEGQKENQSDELAGPSVASVSRPLTLLPPLPARPKRQKIMEQYETEETRTLSTTELQRLVLLKQLHVLKLKEAKLEKEVKKDVLREGEKNYTIL